MFQLYICLRQGPGQDPASFRFFRVLLTKKNDYMHALSSVRRRQLLPPADPLLATTSSFS